MSSRPHNQERQRDVRQMCAWLHRSAGGGDAVGGFSFVDGMSVVVGCAPQSLDRLRDHHVFVA